MPFTTRPSFTSRQGMMRLASMVRGRLLSGDRQSSERADDTHARLLKLRAGGDFDVVGSAHDLLPAMRVARQPPGRALRRLRGIPRAAGQGRAAPAGGTAFGLDE